METHLRCGRVLAAGDCPGHLAVALGTPADGRVRFGLRVSLKLHMLNRVLLAHGEISADVGVCVGPDVLLVKPTFGDTGNLDERLRRLLVLRPRNSRFVSSLYSKSLSLSRARLCSLNKDHASLTEALHSRYHDITSGPRKAAIMLTDRESSASRSVVQATKCSSTYNSESSSCLPRILDGFARYFCWLATFCTINSCIYCWLLRNVLGIC